MRTTQWGPLTASYKDAIRLFRERAGDDARKYLFDREYDALPPDNRARLLLAALSLFARPVGVDELEVTLGFDKQQISDAIGQVSEMFLVVDNVSSQETKFLLGQVTQSYIEKRREKLDYYPTLKARVETLRRNVQPQLKEIQIIRIKVERLLKIGDLAAAWNLVSGIVNPKVSEHPEFVSLRGLVGASQKIPLLEDVRRDFRYCLKMNHIDPVAIRRWFYLERTCGHGLSNAIELCDGVINAKGSSVGIKAEFWAKKRRNFGRKKVSPICCREKMKPTAILPGPRGTLRTQFCAD